MDIQTLTSSLAVAKIINSTPEYVTAAVEAWLSEHVDPSTGYVLDDTLTTQGAAADAKAAGDKTADLNARIDSAFIYPENTTFAEKVAGDLQQMSFSEAIPNIKKFTSLVYYNGRFISSSGSDSYAFYTPYDNFTFAVYIHTSNNAYSVTGDMPKGVVNEPISATVLSGTTVYGNHTQYTIPVRGTLVLFAYRKVDSGTMYAATNGFFKAPNLELDAIQDNFLRYSTRFDDSSFVPFELVKLEGKLVNTTSGGVSSNDSYDTYYFKVPVSNAVITCTNGYRCVIVAKRPEDISANGYLVRVVYNNNNDRVETFSAAGGTYVVFSLAKAQNPTINLKTDLVKAFELPTLRLNYGQKNGFYRIAKSQSATYVYIYFASGKGKVVGWELHNVPAASSNSNTWQIGHVMGYDFDGLEVSKGVELVSGGEFELAFKEYGSADYCGGNNHGDENVVDFTLMIDGKTVDTAIADGDFHTFDRIDAIEHAIVNRCDTPTENILKHQKIWTFENGTVKVRQTLEFLEDLECDFLCCMLAANRSAFTHGVRQGRVGTEDMSTSTFERISTSGNEMMYLMYGANATAKVTAKLPEHSPAGSLWINNAESLNKLYYNYFGQMPSTPVASGTVLKWEQEYDIAYN